MFHLAAGMNLQKLNSGCGWFLRRSQTAATFYFQLNRDFDVQPEAVAHSVQHGSHGLFRCRVLAADAAHVP